jgi:Flp pilus assembly protein TadG
MGASVFRFRATHIRARGQSLTEFALILPLLLTFVGATIDFARLYQGWITLEGATRDAAEFAATYSPDAATAQSDARRVVCNQTRNLPGFQRGAGVPPASIDACTSPTVTVTSFSVSTTAPGATDRFPLGSATVRATVPFQTLFPYPFLAQGTWTLSSTQSYSIIQGRS